MRSKHILLMNKCCAFRSVDR